MSQSKIKRDGLYEETSSIQSLHENIMLVLGEQEHYSPSTPSIYKVPDTLRGLKPIAYSPRVVSIGLIHAKEPRLQPMEEHKESYIYSLFLRTAQSRKTDISEVVYQCVNAMVLEEDRARRCYPPSVTLNVDVNTIARTMLVDGCFILELLMRRSLESKMSDPIFRNLRIDVEHDLLLLENQIPFFVLEKLYSLTAVEWTQNPPYSVLTGRILRYFGNMMNSKIRLEIEHGKNEYADHILGLLHSCYRPDGSDPGNFDIRNYSATELHRSGINFKQSKGDDYKYLLVDFHTPCLFSSLRNIIPNCLFAWLPAITRTIFKTLSCSGADPTGKPVSLSQADTIETPVPEPAEEPVSAPNPAKKHKCCLFSRLCQLRCRPTLEIPQLCIYDSTEAFLRNLIAFEQCSRKTPHHITSYAVLMDTIINSKEDVELLERADVLRNYLGSGEDASNLFNNLCKEVILCGFHYSQQWKQVDDYCKRYWPSHIASMRRTYFSSPWSGISLGAALILFVFTGIQTICSLISLWVGRGK